MNMNLNEKKKNVFISLNNLGLSAFNAVLYRHNIADLYTL